MNSKTIKINDIEYIKKSEYKLANKTDGLTYVIIRTEKAGCFAGYINLEEWKKLKKQKQGMITNARRLWYWSGASSLSQLAMEGVKNPDDCKFPCEVQELNLTGIIEVIPATTGAQNSINSVKIWEQ